MPPLPLPPQNPERGSLQSLLMEGTSHDIVEPPRYRVPLEFLFPRLVTLSLQQSVRWVFCPGTGPLGGFHLWVSAD